MRKILFFILSFFFVSGSIFVVRSVNGKVHAQGTQKQGDLEFPTIPPTSTPRPQNLPLNSLQTPAELTTGTKQVDWVFDNQGRCWNAWSAPSCGLQQHEGGVIVPSMRDLDHDGVEDISCSSGGTEGGTTITNTSNRNITINCEQYTCMACATGNGVHAQCDGGTDPNSQRVVETVVLTPGCIATCTMAGAFGTCLDRQAPPDPTPTPTRTASTIAPTNPQSTLAPTTPPTLIPSRVSTTVPTIQPTRPQTTLSPISTLNPEPTDLPAGAHLPLAIDYSSFNTSYNLYPPTYVYAMMNRSYNAQQTTRGIQGLAAINGNVTKMIMISEYNALEQILTNHADAISAAGITWIGYNAERDGRTPETELNAIFSSSASTNIISKMGRLTDQYGLKLMLGPVTPMWNEYFGREGANPSDNGAAVEAMVGGSNCYLDGVAFQEQKQISRTNKQQRADTVGARAAFFRNHAQNCPQFEAMVQLMSSWCTQNATWEECKGYYNLLKGLQGPARINSLAIWASGSERDDLPRFVQFLRE